MSKPAFFLDRDGTVNVEKNYLHKIEDWEWTSNAVPAIKMLNDAGYLVVVVSNQSGIGRGYYSQTDVALLHQAVDALLAESDARIDAYYVCPHVPEDKACACRKPKPGMLIQASKDLNIDLTRSYMVGDKQIDAMAAIQAGVNPVLVKTGYGAQEFYENKLNVKYYNNLYDAVCHVLSVSEEALNG